MTDSKTHTGVIGALLYEYKVSINDLQQHIAVVKPEDLLKVMDKQTANKDCVSVQAILTHVVYCGYNYITMMDIDRGNADSPWPQRKKLNTVEDYKLALDELYNDTSLFFENVPNSEMVQYDAEKKLTTFWGQLYDYEQLMEHAILHIYRHRRQIVNFKKQLGY